MMIIDGIPFVIDVGMFDGSDSEYYARRGFQVVAIEANPQLCEAARQRFSAAGLDVDVRNVAIAGEGLDEVDFFLTPANLAWSSLNRGLGSRLGDPTRITVRANTLSRELADLDGQIHMIKIDIEGFDKIALKQLSSLTQLPAYCSVENGSLEMLNTMRSLGYERFKLSNQLYNSMRQVPAVSRHGQFVDWVFSPHSSGPFGEDLEGAWRSHEDMARVIEAIEAARLSIGHDNLFAEVVGWFDLHAKV